MQSHSIDTLKSEIVSREQNNDDAGKDTRDQLLWAKRTLLAEMVKQRAMGTLVRMRMSNLTLDVPNKEFFNLENSTKKMQQIHGLLTLNGTLTTSQQGLRGVLKDYYSNLYSPCNVENEANEELIAGPLQPWQVQKSVPVSHHFPHCEGSKGWSSNLLRHLLVLAERLLKSHLK